MDKPLVNAAASARAMSPQMTNLTAESVKKLLNGDVSLPDEAYWTTLTPYASVIDPNTNQVRVKADANQTLAYAPREKLDEAIESNENLIRLLRTRQKYRDYSTLSPLDEKYAKQRANQVVLSGIANVDVYGEAKQRELDALQQMYEQDKQQLAQLQIQLKIVVDAIERLERKNAELGLELRNIDAQLRPTAVIPNRPKSPLYEQLIERQKQLRERFRRNSDLLQRKRAEADEWRKIIQDERTDEFALRRRIEESLNRSLTRAVGWPFRKTEQNYDERIQQLVDAKLGATYDKLAKEVKAYEAQQRTRFQNLVE